MAWKKYFKVANSSGQLSPLSGRDSDGLPGYGRNDGRDTANSHADIVYRNYASRLPEVYTGHPNRVQRYNQYEQMDLDSEINAGKHICCVGMQAFRRKKLYVKSRLKNWEKGLIPKKNIPFICFVQTN